MNRFSLIFILSLIISPIFTHDLQAGENSNIRPCWLFRSTEYVEGPYTSFCQDKKGFLWVGTDRGLLRFDGNSYDLFLPDSSVENSLSDNRILNLLCDSSGKVWVATANGLNLYEPETNSFKLIKLPSKNFNGYIIAITEQPEGIITFIASGVGMYNIGYQNGEPVAIKYLQETESENNYNSLVCSPDGKMYAGTPDGIVCIISKNGNVSRVRLSDNYIKNLVVESDGNIIVGDLVSLYRIHSTDHRVEKLMLPKPIQLSRMSNDNSGTIYIGTAGQGLWKVEKGSDRLQPCHDIYSPFLNLATADIGAVFCSPDGNLWLGCNYSGVVMIPKHSLPFTYRKISDLFPDYSGSVRAMTIWKGHVLIGLNNGRVALLAPDGKPVLHKNIPGEGEISSFIITDSDKALIGMANNGVWELSLPDGAIRKVVEIPGKYPSIVMAPGNQDEIFIAAHGLGLIRYNLKTGEKISLKHNHNSGYLTNPFITSLCKTEDNKIWAATYSGLACYDLIQDSFLPIDQDPFLEGTSFAVVPFKEKGVLVATSHGLIQLDSIGGEIHKFTQEDGLMDKDIRSIDIDKDGGVWMGTLRGLAYKSPESGRIINY